ncbi:hypothetical protein ACFY9R_21725 [Streptomyces albidoflavus]|uniref:hypothetical protein n=1 Tax=Streptomyces albidoflavus TaxID=1886 RepID=UPI0033EF53FF
MGRWTIGYPTGSHPEPPPEPDENDYCRTCQGRVTGAFVCVCADLVTPAPHQL